MDLSQAQKQLAVALEGRYGSREGALIADWVMEHLTGLRKLDRLVRKTEVFSAGMLRLYDRYTAELVAGRPVQYVLGESWFGGLKFYVDERVLIPRPETEELVDWVLAETAETTMGGRDGALAENRPVVLDVGTGSGCIAITLSRGLPDAAVYAVDVSNGALTVAKRNAGELEAAVHFLELNFLDVSSWDRLPPVQWLVSNPPYIPASEGDTMAPHVVDAEPALALFVDDGDALVFYRALGEFARRRLIPGGALYAEIHEELGAAVSDVLVQQGAREVILRKDLQGKDRMVKATW
ncbi:MAG TPA: peptide chain release factor N(5)-glutamine methyltransferase [Puia sp.]|nr:peptide chain release factor N(5)-glutamine methyltransferase [Puia sp.]